MRIKNGKVFVGKTFVEADIAFDSVITAIGKLEGEADFDAEGCYVIPGLVYAIADLYFGSLLPGILIHWINNFVTFTLVGTDAGAMPLPTLLVSGSGDSVSVASMFLGTIIPYGPIMVYILWDAWKKKKTAKTC